MFGVLVLAACLVYISSSVAVTKVEFRDVNILVVTDTHSWLAGHIHTDQLPIANATIGNITSFVTTMKSHASLAGKDVFFFDNGDVVDGTGLSNASPINGQELFPLLMEIPFDAMAVGNHELYDESTFKEMVSSGYMACRNGTYLASNVYMSGTLEPIASRYTILVGPNSGVRLLVFGVLYDMTDNTDVVTVQTVESMVSSPWFLSALMDEEYDAIVVLAHMDYQDPLIDVILRGIRARVSSQLPIQFLTGHSHIRANSAPDSSSGNIEAGNYYNTIGYSSFNLPKKGSAAGTEFIYAFYEPNTEYLAQILDLTEDGLETDQGIQLDLDIAQTRQEMGLVENIGQADRHYSIETPVTSSSSLYNLYLSEVAPSMLFSPPYNSSQILVTGTGLLRYDLFAGPVIVDDIWTLCPFSEPYFVLQSISGGDIRKALHLLNSEKYNPFLKKARRSVRPFVLFTLPSYVSSAIPNVGEIYDVLGSQWDVEFIAEALGEVIGTAPPVAVQYGDSSTTDLWFQWMDSMMHRKSS